jgi:hypothetical protein
LSHYDFADDTIEHIRQVQSFLIQINLDLAKRMGRHDLSKLEEPEKSVFDEYTPKLREANYGSDKYKALLAEMDVAVQHHYEANDHHPEHFDNGIADMDLVQVMEMLADWKAATLRRADGDLRKGIEFNAERFGYGEEFKRLLKNTAEHFGWLNQYHRPSAGEEKITK